jgi:hypothetical protein
MSHENFAPPGEVRSEAKPAKRERNAAKFRAREAKRNEREAAKLAKRQAAKSVREAKRAEASSRNEDAPGVRTVRTVFALVSITAAAAFAIQAWMSYRFAKDVWDIPRPLCVAIIAMLDLFAVTFMVLTYLLRRAGFGAQIYVWVLFIGSAASQVFAAEQYGAKEVWSGPVRSFAALPAIFLAASLHGLIIWRNHSASAARRQPAVAPPAPAPAVKRPEPIAIPRPLPADPPVPRIVQPKPQVTATRAPVPPRASATHSAAADRVIAEKATAKDVAAELGVSPRAVQLWVQARRKELAAKPQVNGHVFVPAEQGVN